MSYYKNSVGKVAKVVNSWGLVVVMMEYRTIFFDDLNAARAFLVARGFF